MKIKTTHRPRPNPAPPLQSVPLNGLPIPPPRHSERADRQVEDIHRLALQGGACRLASYLLGQLPAGRSEYRLRVTKGVLAARLGLRAETLSRVLTQLSAEGITSVTSGNTVPVPDRQRLRHFIERGGKV